MKLEQNLVEKISVKTSGKVSAPYFKTVFIDSRLQVEQGLFIPIIGERFDGHEFIFDAIKNGAVATLWDVSKPIPNELIESQFPVFYVNDTLTALQQLAKHYLEFVKPRVIAVTGSNGKTSTKDLIESVVSQVYKTHKTKGNYNNHIGLPLTILSMPSDCEVIILEMGMSDFGEISLLSRIANPDFAVITNIGESHIEQLGSREGIATAKYEIIDGLKEKGVVILDGDEPLLKVYQHECLITCGYDTNNHFQITHYQMDENGITFCVNGNSDYHIELLGKHNVKNSVYAIAIGKYLNIDEHTIQIGLKKGKLTGMRMEKKAGYNQSLIINDAYNASPTSMKAAIETIKQLKDFEKRVIVLGDMYELGEKEKELHISVVAAITAPITHIFTVGEKGRWIAEALLEAKSDSFIIKSYQNKEEVVDPIKKLLDNKTVVLLKASRGMGLESVAMDLYQ